MNIEVDRLFKPSEWSNRFENAIDVLNSHTNFVSSESNRVRSNYQVHLNIAYGPSEDERYDLFLANPQWSSVRKLIVFVHGGYWQEMSKSSYSFVAEPFLKNNCNVVIVGYSLCPTVQLETIVWQIRRAVCQCFRMAIENGVKYVDLIGHSAGAHLITAASQFDSSIFDHSVLGVEKLSVHFVLLSGVYDLTQLPLTTLNDALKLDYHTANDLSPLKFESFKIPKRHKITIVVGQFDSPVFREQSKLFFEKLRAELNIDLDENTVNFFELENTDHFEIVENFLKQDFFVLKLLL